MLTLARNVEVAARKARPIPHTTEDAIARLRERRANLHEVESKAAPHLDAQIAIGTVAQQYPDASILDTSVLRWRYDTRFLRSTIFKVPIPKLALINVSSPTFFLSYDDDGRWQSSIMPEGIPEKCYSDILKQLRHATSFVKKTVLSFTWQGLIPDEASSIIKEAEDFFGNYKGTYRGEIGSARVYLLVESPHEQWTIKNEEKERVRYLDPLILGHLGKDLFVLGSFDPTPIEEYIMAEFTMKELTT